MRKVRLWIDRKKFEDLQEEKRGIGKALAEWKRIWYGEGGVFANRELKNYYRYYDACKDLKLIEHDRRNKQELRDMKKGETAAVVFVEKPRRALGEFVDVNKVRRRI